MSLTIDHGHSFGIFLLNPQSSTVSFTQSLRDADRDCVDRPGVAPCGLTQG